MTDFMEWVTHGVKRGSSELKRPVVVGLAASMILLALVGLFYLLLVSHTAAQGRQIEDLQREFFRLQRENAQLEVEIARVSAISRLQQRAEELGFVPAEQIEYIGGGD